MNRELTIEQAKPLFEQGRANGVRDEEIMLGLINRGYKVKGVDTSGLKDYLQDKRKQDSIAKQEPKRNLSQKIAGFLGIENLGKGLGQSIASGEVAKKGEDALKIATETQTKALQEFKNAQLSGDQERIKRAQRALAFSEEAVEQANKIQQGFIEDTPANRQVIGSAINLATLAVGPSAFGAATKGLSGAAKIGAAGAVGAAEGAAFTTGSTLTEESRLPTTSELTTGALIGAAIPGSIEAIAPVRKALTSALSRAGQEVSGSLTGTSQETLDAAFEIVKKGGDDAERFKQALRGEVTPESIVTNLRDSVQQVKSKRDQAFSQTISEIGNEIVDTSNVRSSFEESLNKFGIKVVDGQLDFKNSKLRTSPSAISKVQTAFNEIKNISKNNPTVSQVDTTRQALGVLRLTGDDASANAANAIIDSARGSVRKSAESVPGYKKMLDEFGTSSEFLDELERGLSTSDKKTIDQTYRRLVTSLKTNNEQRKALVEQLDAETGGNILADISGQQLSEYVPRGILGRFLAGGLTTAAASGILTPTILPSLVFSSPRLTGEFINALGISARKANQLKEGINQSRKYLKDVYGVAPENFFKTGAIQQATD